jgi:GLPGLI family protein
MIVQSQKKISTNFKYKVLYNLTYTLDSTNLEDKKSEKMVLFLGDSISTFSSQTKLFKNSVVVKGNTAYSSKETLTAFPHIIIKNLGNNYLANTLQIADDYFFYKQGLNLFNWKLENETKKIKDYTVQKAITSFAGRNYIAWFTIEIPISDGPYKFSGLPGLILEISDLDNHYKYELLSLERLKPTIPFKINFKDYLLTDKEKLSEVRFRYRKDPFTYTNNPNVKITPEVHQEYIKLFTEILEKENNPIEK